MGGIAYPRRDDLVRYEKFDGSLESVQRIVNLTKTELTISFKQRPNFLEGDKLTISSIPFSGGAIQLGDFVTVSNAGQVSVFPGDVFHAKFDISKIAGGS
ncbi:hypothetical protein AVU99_gp112 [Mycobacterium phage Lolly9]|uniref:Uncharacterized protein n=1 Tax=Mycobacterium phage Lolly9 TaxID=1698711 RepID=A0A0K2FNL1_9CAUD|nr:hypothetical protein AVU99_gp112 [Mycobacterium phage Lolly9]ALA48485.1 hypothetical protein LOLLY9_68 [Mycobacterium phage Lolly9]QOP65796.1 hypothetical protein PBI_MINILON_72 [Mycobacterium phage MiniLon]QOP66543.1 hypothetical protein PBI_MINIMAC_72 [Mycobacterium phage MiniMac]